MNVQVGQTMRTTTGMQVRCDVTTVRPIRASLDGRRVEVWQFIDGQGLEYPPGTVLVRLMRGFGPRVEVLERRVSPPGADLKSAIEAAEEMLK